MVKTRKIDVDNKMEFVIEKIDWPTDYKSEWVNFIAHAEVVKVN